MLHLNLALSHSDEPEPKVSSGRNRSMSEVSELHVPQIASLQQVEHPQLGDISPSRAPSPYSSSPPSSPPSFSSSAVPESGIHRPFSNNISDAEDDNFPWTPHSKQSGGPLPHAVNPCESARAGVGSPTPNRLAEIDSTHAFYPHPMITSFEDQHYFDRFLGRPVNDGHSLEDISQKVQDIYFSHIERLSAHSVRCAVHYKEAVRERKRMRWYTARWEVAEVQRLHTLVRSLCDESETEFIMADRESRWLLDVLVKRQTSPTLAMHAQYASATCDNDKKSLHLADAELALLASRSQSIEL
ncbi:uncharacterized protein F5891DRAFT_1194782 [Suillus fuscotomentosus]|uniref:Uncharacterized protein n=1 Tax=Suillus fuscotomentosus TaxID=1912939 RepID=A0AAD4DW95_9AGAM|nr:uncharacterized protein F5891DRAFT_1194782 [Suillus fuscotomentosus]KAG1894797.1 hypothetical protein F5891DRAFT_1194782 [Suillus fuscotomentosus]